jgi:hypothetical protein
MQPSGLPSIPPRGVSWPMVGYALVRELPSSLSIVSGCVVAVVLIMRAPGASLEPIAALVVPAIISALARSRPAEPLDVSKLSG